MYNVGTLTLTGCTVSGNSAAEDGGGVATIGGSRHADRLHRQRQLGHRRRRPVATIGGAVTLTDCTVSGNTARNGGGLYDRYGTLTLTNCTVSGNYASRYGGGLDNRLGISTLTGCTVSGNSASLPGGGLDNLYVARSR